MKCADIALTVFPPCSMKLSITYVTGRKEVQVYVGEVPDDATEGAALFTDADGNTYDGLL